MEAQLQQPDMVHDPSPRRGVEPSVEVVPKAKRRKFSEAYKLRILEEVDQNPGNTGADLPQPVEEVSKVASVRYAAFIDHHLSEMDRAAGLGGAQCRAARGGPARRKSRGQQDM